jgi:hypothetical protein
MRHHLDRAKSVYRSRGLMELARSAVAYVPIELNNLLFRLRYGSGTAVMEEDWDTLILLDACRYNMFADAVELDGELDSRISLGSTSEEFLDRNFSDGQFHDTVYVNANVYLPHLGLDQDGTFHAVIDLLDDWDPELEIAHPETVTDAARRAHDEFPNKRVIVHYMQPHIPFIGEYGWELQDRIGRRSVWKDLRDGKQRVGMDEIWKAYRENLDFVLEYVEELLAEISGKAVISADHGNMVGERHGPIPTKKMYGHPWGVYAPQLVKVPWFEIESGDRRTVTTDPPVAVRKQSEELIQERLRSLGYTE